MEAEADRADLVANLQVGSFIEVQPTLPGMHHRVYVARVERTFPSERLAEVFLYRTASEGRAGPWQRRRWDLWVSPDGSARRELLPEAELLCPVTLEDQALTMDSLERLASYGVDVGTQPHRDRSLPPPRMLE